MAFTDSGLLAHIRFETLVGDQIWVIRDAPAPVILRRVPRSPRFTLIGPAYVDGVMFGEALKDLDCPRLATIEIV